MFSVPSTKKVHSYAKGQNEQQKPVTDDPFHDLSLFSPLCSHLSDNGKRVKGGVLFNPGPFSYSFVLDSKVAAKCEQKMKIF
jgi:hypothetical protein